MTVETFTGDVVNMRSGARGGAGVESVRGRPLDAGGGLNRGWGASVGLGVMQVIDGALCGAGVESVKGYPLDTNSRFDGVWGYL